MDTLEISLGISDTQSAKPTYSRLPSVIMIYDVAWSESLQSLFTAEVPVAGHWKSVLYRFDSSESFTVMPADWNIAALEDLPLSDVEFSPDGKYVFIAVVDPLEDDDRAPEDSTPIEMRGNSLWRYEIESGLLEQFGLSFRSIWMIRPSPRGEFLALSSTRGVLVFDFENEQWNSIDHRSAHGIAWSPDGQSLAVISPTEYGTVGFAIYALGDLATK